MQQLRLTQQLQPDSIVGRGTYEVCLFSGRGTRVLAAGSARTVDIWNPSTGQLSARFGQKEHRKDITALDLHRPRTNQVVCGGGDGILYLWDLEKAQCVSKLRAHHGRITDAKFLVPDVIASTGQDATLRFFDSRSPERSSLLQTQEDAKDTLTWVDFADAPAEQPLIYTASLDGCWRTYDVRFGVVETLDLKAPILTATLGPNRQVAAVAFAEGPVALLDHSKSGQIIARVDGRVAAAHKIALAFSPNGTLLSAGDAQRGKLRVWELPGGELEEHSDISASFLHLREREVNDCPVVANGVASRMFRSAAETGERQPKERVERVHNDKRPLLPALCANSSESTLVTGYGDGTLRLWEWPATAV